MDARDPAQIRVGQEPERRAEIGRGRPGQPREPEAGGGEVAQADEGTGPQPRAATVSRSDSSGPIQARPPSGVPGSQPAR